MTLKIISAEDIIFEGEAKAVHLPGSMGAFTVLPGHASLVATLTPGTIRFTTPDGEEEQRHDITGGIADVNSDVISVCVY
ncbi:MAG: ATP synthase F1 subunit epsilon [Duncaniella sp.]|nr:ATP synthase F1 subunit epsilon [Duncaniella sp.]